MTTRLSIALNQHEKMVSDGKIKSFTVRIGQNGVLIKPDGSGKEQTVQLLPDLYSSLSTYFFGAEAIVFASFDYTTLKSLLNTHATLDRMAETKQRNDENSSNV